MGCLGGSGCHLTLDLRVISLSPLLSSMLGMKPTSETTAKLQKSWKYSIEKKISRTIWFGLLAHLMPPVPLNISVCISYKQGPPTM